MSETLKALLLSVVGGLLTAALVFAGQWLLKRVFPYVLKWLGARARIVPWLYLGGLALTAALFIGWSLTSLALKAPFSTYGVAVVTCAFVADMILGYFLLRLPVWKEPVVVPTPGFDERIAAILQDRHQYISDEIQREAIGYALTAVREAVNRYGPFWVAGRPVVPPDLMREKIVDGKPTIGLALKIQELLVQHCLQGTFTHASVYSDETEKFIDRKAEYMWMIDAIDGSRHLARHIPLFTLSLALLQKNETLLSVIYVPITDELFFAAKGMGAYLNTWSARLHVSNTDMTEAIAYVEFPNKRLLPQFQADFESQCAVLRSLFEKISRVRGFGLGSLGLAYVAKGAFDAYLTLTGTTLRNDVIAGALLVKEAGGQVCLFPAPHVVRHNTRVIAANPHVYEELRKMVKHA